MRFLIDNALSPDVARGLQAAWHDALHVKDLGIAHAVDEVILDRAHAGGLVLVSADTDFGTILNERRARSPSIVLFRRVSGRSPAAQVATLLATLPSISPMLLAGAIVVIEDSRVRIRTLPIAQ